jgi:hypothetical protein
MAVTSGAGRVVRQSRQYLPYRTGNSQLALFTFTLGTCAAGITKRVGLFDDANGLFLEQTSAGLSLVVRSSTTGQVVETRIAQSDWNIDTLLSGEPSIDRTGLVLDPTKTQIFVTSFQWLGVGAITFGFDLDGAIIPVHRINNANNLLDVVYMSTPNLPVRYELINASTNAGQLQQICASVMREGAADDSGIEVAVSSGATAVTAVSGVLTSVVAVRLKSGYIRSRISPGSLQLLNTGGVPVRYTLSLNPTTTGSFANWTSRGTGFVSEYSLSALPVTSEGIVLDTGYIAAGQGAGQARSTIAGVGGLASALDVAASIAGTSDVLVLSAAGIGNDCAVYGALRYAELY